MAKRTDDGEKKEKAPPPDFLLFANQFLMSTGKKVVFWGGCYFEYNGKCYVEMGNKDTMKLSVCKWRGQYEIPVANNQKNAGEIEFQLRANTVLPEKQAVPAPIESCEANSLVLTMRNGRLDLGPLFTNGEDPVLLRHDPNWFSTSCLPFDYQPGSSCPMFLKFLGECLEGDQQRIDLMQEWFGYCCTHDTSYEKALFMRGGGANGKSQVIEILKRLVGQGNYSSVPLEKIGCQFQDVPMLGKLVNFSAETPERAVIHVSHLRQLISGDPYQFEPKNVNTFTAKPTAKFVIAMNTPPAFLDKSEALWRRMLMMPFNYTPPKDKIILEIGRKIADAELPGIFVWAIEGLRRLRANQRFTESTVMHTALEHIRTENDPWRTELRDIFESCTDGFITSNECWLRHLSFVSSSNSDIPETSTATAMKLASEIKRVFPFATPEKRTINGKQVRGWAGIRARTQDAQSASQSGVGELNSAPPESVTTAG